MPQTVDKSFFDYSKEIVQNFLQTVVAVDDELSFEKPAIVEIDENIDEPDESFVFGSSENSPPASAKKNPLNYQLLSTAFAQNGIVCSGFRPLVDQEDSLSAIVQTSKNADITILDWQMDGQNPDGTLATDAINRLAKNDKKEGGRLRLIIVYTAENIQDVTEKLSKSLDSDFSSTLDGQTISLKDELLTHWKIDVISKTTSEKELTSEVINSFAQLTAGLLSNAALSAIADVRDKTHNILHKFNKTLDPAYLSHVFGLLSLKKVREQCHEAAFDYAAELISEELKSDIQTSEKIKFSLSETVLKKWPKYINNSQVEKYFSIKLPKNKNYEFGNDGLMALLSVKTDEELGQVLKEKIGHSSSLSSFENKPIFFSVNGSKESALHDFSVLECQRRSDLSINESYIPTLKLGTILKRVNVSKYYFCVQPLCDSTRITSCKSFILLEIPEHTDEFSHVIKYNRKHIYLKINISAELITTAIFDHSQERRAVIPVKKNNKLIFSARDDFHNQEIRFEWVAELKTGPAQAIANELSSKISRVGLDTFEWLRLKNR